MQKTKDWTPDEAAAIGGRLRQARNARGLSLDQVAERLGVSKGTVGHWETAKRTIKLHDLVQVCGSLDVSADEILFGVKRWPFRGLDFDLVNDLDPQDVGRLEGAMLQAASGFGLQIQRDLVPGTTAEEYEQTAAKRKPLAGMQVPARRQPRAAERAATGEGEIPPKSPRRMVP